MSMNNFTIEELGYFVTLCGAVAVSCVAIVIKSRCKTIDTPCIKCKRDVIHDKTEQVLKETVSNTQIEDNKINSNTQIEDIEENP